MELQYERSPQGYGGQRNKFLRIPISTELLYQWSQGIYPKANVNDFVNPELKGKNSLELLTLPFSAAKNSE